MTKLFFTLALTLLFIVTNNISFAQSKNDSTKKSSSSSSSSKIKEKNKDKKSKKKSSKSKKKLKSKKFSKRKSNGPSLTNLTSDETHAKIYEFPEDGTTKVEEASE